MKYVEMDKKATKPRSKGRPRKHKESTAIRKSDIDASPNVPGDISLSSVNIPFVSSNDDRLAQYLLSSHDGGHADTYTFDKKQSSGVISKNLVPPNKRYRMINVTDGAVEELPVPFSGYIEGHVAGISNRNSNHSARFQNTASDRLTASPIQKNPISDSHKRLSPQIMFPPHLERQSPHFTKVDIKSSPSRLSPYFDHRYSPDMFHTEMQSFNRNTALDLSPAAANASSPARDTTTRPSVSPFKAHLLQAVPESERYSPSRYTITPDRDEIKTISQTPPSLITASATTRKNDHKPTLVRMLKDGSNLVPVTIVSNIVYPTLNNNITRSASSLSSDSRTNVSPIKAVLTNSKPMSLLREHLTTSVHNSDGGVNYDFNETIPSTMPQVFITNPQIPKVLVTEEHQNVILNRDNTKIMHSSVSPFSEIIGPKQIPTLNVINASHTSPIHTASQQAAGQPMISYVSYTTPTNTELSNQPSLPEVTRTKIQPPANPFFQNLRVIDDAVCSDISKLAYSTTETGKYQAKLKEQVDVIDGCVIKQTEIKNEVNEDNLGAVMEHVTFTCPFNKRKEILSKFNNTNSTFRSKVQSVAMHRIRHGCTTSAAKSLDILRRNLQKSLNDGIAEVVKFYIDKFFKPAIENMKFNNGTNSVSEEHIQVVSRQILEEAKKMYDCESRRSVSPIRDTSDTVSEAGSYSGNKRLHNGLNRLKLMRPSDSDSELSVPPKRKKGRPPLHFSSGRSTPSKTMKADSVKRDGPKWDPERLTTDTEFVMGARANKALGLGATRGRLYIKHPSVFKYSGDQEDKQWLYDHHYMPAAGGKAYLLLVSDIRELGETDEYRNSPLLMMNEILSFTVPQFMIDKMKVQMLALSTSNTKTSERIPADQSEAETIIPGLPFSNFMEEEPKIHKDIQLSPANTEDMELLSTGTGENDDQPQMSPFTMTGGFDDVNSPAPSDFETLGDEHTLSAPFDLSK